MYSSGCCAQGQGIRECDNPCSATKDFKVRVMRMLKRRKYLGFYFSISCCTVHGEAELLGVHSPTVGQI